MWFVLKHLGAASAVVGRACSDARRGVARSGAYELLIEGSSADGSGTVIDRYGEAHLVLAAGTYTIEAAAYSAGGTGTYSVWVRRYDLTPCVSDLGVLEIASPSEHAVGSIERDPDCFSSQRDPDDTKSAYYARRYTFTLGAPAAISVSAGPSGQKLALGVLLIEGRSNDGTGTVVASSVSSSGHRAAQLSSVVLGAGAYTVEVTTSTAGHRGQYRLSVQRAAVPRDVTVTAAAASESDGAAVFTLEASAPASAGGFGD